MSIRLTTTAQAAQATGLKCLVHGESGAGKTTLCATTGEPTVIISAEGGMLSLGRHNIPVIEVASMADMKQAYDFLMAPAQARFTWWCLDSISEIAEKILATEKAAAKDPRKAYGAMNDQLDELIKVYRDAPGKNVLFTCKTERVKDDATGITSYVPSLPGKAASQGIEYYFDEVLCYRVDRDPADPAKIARYLQTGRDYSHAAKDRSGALALFEPPNMAHIKAKIVASFQQPQQR